MDGQDGQDGSRLTRAGRTGGGLIVFDFFAPPPSPRLRRAGPLPWKKLRLTEAPVRRFQGATGWVELFQFLSGVEP
jgi:hypothetical protein